jgi:hypothetical protein
MSTLLTYKQRDHFLRDLIEQSADGRLGNQDADGPLELEDESRRLEVNPHVQLVYSVLIR